MLHIGDCLINLLEVDSFVSSGTKVIAVMKSGAKVPIETSMEEVVHAMRRFTGIPVFDSNRELRHLRCKHCEEVYMNPLDEQIVLCDRDGLYHNATLGECFGNCESEKV